MASSSTERLVLNNSAYHSWQSPENNSFTTKERDQMGWRKRNVFRKLFFSNPQEQ